MPRAYEDNLREELEQFKLEKEKIRNLVGQIGGKDSQSREKAINVIFLVAVLVLFGFDVSRHLLHIFVPLPPMFSLELGILLVSIKIVIMMNTQARVDHFQFWILNSLEYRLNDISKRLQRMETNLPTKSYQQ